MTFLRIPLVLFLLVALAACSDDSPAGNDDNNNNNNNNNNSSFQDEVTATVNGDAWEATNYAATYTANGVVVAVTLTAFGPDNSNISFGIALASEKSHAIEDGSAVQASFEYNGVTYGDGETGTVNITSLSSEGMKGTFTINANSSTGQSGTATGEFDVSF